jgi:3-deoxy-D-manno-octulosonic-acid transferase
VIRSLINIFYNAALLLLLVLGSPWWASLWLGSSKFREGLGERFFGVSRSFGATLPGRSRIWIHAVSVGEVLAISGLVQALSQRAPEYAIVISTTTRTGQKLARERFGPERCFYFPLDFPWSVQKTLKRVKPAFFILAESELWPNMLSACFRKNVPVVVVNARISDRSLPKYLRLRLLWAPYLQMLTKVFAQTAQDADRLRQIGVPAERVKVGGNLKFDIRPPENVAIKAQLQQHLLAGTKLLICGSTLDDEEAQLLAPWPKILQSVPNAVMLLAPRHPERFDAVTDLLAASPHPFTQRSQWAKQPKQILPGSIFLLDSIGELAALYSLARVAFIGGSLVAAGGHNPLEAAQFGVPVVMGPSTENFRAMVQLLTENDAIVIAQPGEIAEILIELLLDDAKAAALGENGRRVCEQQAGATDRCASAIIDLLRGRA